MQGKKSKDSVMETPDVCSKETENGDAKQQGGSKKKGSKMGTGQLLLHQQANKIMLPSQEM
jgi:hypothetical protein